MVVYGTYGSIWDIAPALEYLLLLERAAGSDREREKEREGGREGARERQCV